VGRKVDIVVRAASLATLLAMRRYGSGVVCVDVVMEMDS
jgi:hypothetical protein